MCQIKSIHEMGCKSPLSLKIEQYLFIILKKFIMRFLIIKIKIYKNLIVNYLKELFKKSSRIEDTKDSKISPLFFIKVGDIVKIRSKEQILQTLDEGNKLDGCYFMDEMRQYCGGKYKVIKRVKFFFDEAKSRMRKTRNTVLLEGLYCSGKMPFFKQRCDRSCLIFWKEGWLEKVE